MKRNRKEKKEILYDVFEQLSYLEDSFEPYINKELEHLKEKYNLKKIRSEFKMKWHLKIDF